MADFAAVSSICWARPGALRPGPADRVTVTATATAVAAATVGSASRTAHRALARVRGVAGPPGRTRPCSVTFGAANAAVSSRSRSEEHTSELQSRPHLVCRLLL